MRHLNSYPDRWWKWRQSESNGTLMHFTHKKPPCSDAVLEIIKPIYEDLIGFSESNTQNNHESLISFICKSKRLYSGETIEIPTHLCIFK